MGSYVSFVHTDYLSEKQLVECRDEIEKISRFPQTDTTKTFLSTETSNLSR